MTATMKLGEVFDIRKGKKAEAVADSQIAGSFPYIQIDEVRGIKPRKFAVDPKPVLATEDDLCIVWDGANAGTIGYGIDGAVGSTVARMRLKNRNDWEPRFLGRLLDAKFPQLNQEAQGRGATIPHVDKAKLEAIEFPRIPRSEQRRIATILDKADATRRKHQQAVVLTDDFLKSLFLEIFGDPAKNDRGWQISLLEELGDVQGGLQVTSKRLSMELTLPYLRVANVYRDCLNLYEIKEINLSEAEFKRTRLETGDILIVEGHGNPDEIGRAAIWDGSIDRCVHQNHLIRFRANRKRALPDFISRFLNSDGGRQQLIGAGRTTSGLNTISTRKVKEVLVPLPPLELQKRFAQIVRKQAALTSRLQSQLATSGDLFATLSQRAFRGEL